MDDPIAERMEASASLIDTISKSNLSKLIFGGISGVFIYSLWENRNNVLLALLSSQSAMVVMGTIMVFLTLGWIAMGIMAKIEKSQQAIQMFQQERIKQLEEQVDSDHRLMLDALERIERVEMVNRNDNNG